MTTPAILIIAHDPGCDIGSTGPLWRQLRASAQGADFESCADVAGETGADTLGEAVGAAMAGTRRTTKRRPTMTATATTSEQELRTKIAALDRKIEAQRKHIAKLEAELAEKRNERTDLVRQRIQLLQSELPEEVAE